MLIFSNDLTLPEWPTLYYCMLMAGTWQASLCMTCAHMADHKETDINFCYAGATCATWACQRTRSSMSRARAISRLTASRALRYDDHI